MNKALYEKLKNTFKNEDITLDELCSVLYAEDFYDATCVLNEFFEGNFQDVLLDEDFFGNYLLFLYHLTKKIKDDDNLFKLKNMIEKNIKTIKDFLKDYHKDEKHKDSKFNIGSIYLHKLKDLLEIIDYEIKNSYESEEFRIMWFVTTVLKKSDYLFRIIELHPEYVNLKDKNNKSLFVLLIENFIVNLKLLSDEDIKYYKRVFVMLLESDELHLVNEEIFYVLELLEKNKISASIKNKQDINFCINEIDRHYEIISQDFRVNAIDYCKKKCPIEIVTRNNEERIDLTESFVFSIDSIVGNEKTKRLIDDAFSFKVNEDGTFTVCMHIPDVDYYVKKDSLTDQHMRALGETVYARDYKTPMLPYEIAEKCSLIAGEKRPAITIKAQIDSSGKVLNLDFLKSIINVNYNLSRYYAEMFMKKNNDNRLFVLNEAYDFATMLRKNRKEKVGKRSKAYVIMDEINIFMDLITAEYFLQNGIVFPYKNYAGKRSIRNVIDVSACEKFATTSSLSETGKDILYNVFDIHNRVYYDTKNYGNKSFNGHAVGNIGNPLREYISLETDRLIKDLVIEKLGNIAYWEERIERDCIEYTETSAKIKQLYK